MEQLSVAGRYLRLQNERALSLGSGRVGLRNIGNTCYLNAVVQCLSHTQALRDYCLTKTYLQEMCSNQEPELMNEFTSVLEELWCAEENKKPINPEVFYGVFIKAVPSFQTDSQHDAQEFLLFLLDQLHSEIKRQTAHHAALSPTPEPSSTRLRSSKTAAAIWGRHLDTDDSVIVDLFSGQLRSSVRCSVCSHSSITFEVFYDLSLSIPKRGDLGAGVSLRECLNLFSHKEKIYKENSHMCKNCNHRSGVTKGLTIQRFPQILVIHLKRFLKLGPSIWKRTTPVSFPLTDLDLRPLGAGDCGSVLYDLCALCNHTGTMDNGHYTAVCKDEGGWYCYNDSWVTQISEDHLQFEEPYLLFYKLKP